MRRHRLIAKLAGVGTTARTARGVAAISVSVVAAVAAGSARISVYLTGSSGGVVTIAA